MYEVALGDQSEVQTIGFHAHAFMLVLFVALVLATPRLGLRGRRRHAKRRYRHYGHSGGHSRDHSGGQNDGRNPPRRRHRSC